MAANETPQYWFPAKRYGWGWGFPNNWQGWAAYLTYTVLLILGMLVINPAHNIAGFLLYTTAISAVLLGIRWVKGERPSWRWGNSDA